MRMGNSKTVRPPIGQPCQGGQEMTFVAAVIRTSKRSGPKAGRRAWGEVSRRTERRRLSPSSTDAFDPSFGFRFAWKGLGSVLDRHRERAIQPLEVPGLGLRRQQELVALTQILRPIPR